MNVNVLINSTKQKVKELTANFPYSEEEINLITICYIAISAIDSDIEDLLDDVYAFLLEHYTLKNVNELDDLLRNYEHSNKYEIWDFFRRKNKGYPRERIRINTDI